MNASILIPLLLQLATVDPRIEEAQQLAAHGETVAARGQYEAILRDLEAGGADGSAALHYNLGTLALNDDDVGAAVLHLLAAYRRDPGHEDVVHNLARAQDVREDRVEAGASASLSVATLGGRLPPRGARVAAGLAFALLGVVFAWRAVLGRRLPGVLVVLVTVVAGATLAAWGARRAFERRVLVVVLEPTVARSSPDARADGFDVHPGLSGERVDATAEWWRVRLENGLDVWLSSTAARVVP